MNHHENISSYIDNELNPEQEQEFLISLAASENLRKAFRSELVLKNVLHQDERLTAPPRDLRAGVFLSLGIADAAMNAVSNPSSSATQTSAAAPATQASFFKTLFATKINTLLTSLTLGASALIGFTTHAVITEQSPVASQQVTRNVGPAPVITLPSTVTEPEKKEPLASVSSDNALLGAPSVQSKAKVKVTKKRAVEENTPASVASKPATTPEQTIGVGDVSIKPQVNRNK